MKGRGQNKQDACEGAWQKEDILLRLTGDGTAALSLVSGFPVEYNENIMNTENKKAGFGES